MRILPASAESIELLALLDEFRRVDLRCGPDRLVPRQAAAKAATSSDRGVISTSFTPVTMRQ
jgi:hypothetical protein